MLKIIMDINRKASIRWLYKILLKMRDLIKTRDTNKIRFDSLFRT